MHKQSAFKNAVDRASACNYTKYNNEDYASVLLDEVANENFLVKEMVYTSLKEAENENIFMKDLVLE